MDLINELLEPFLNSFWIFIPAAIVIMTFVIIASLLASLISFLADYIRKQRAQEFILGKYNRYYLTDTDVAKDDRIKEMLPYIGRGYGIGLEEYYASISEDRLPPCVVMNWTRSIIDDLLQAPLPSIRVKKWHEMIKKSNGGIWANRVSLTDFIEFEDYEKSFIWGCVFCWLKIYHCDCLTDQLEQTIYSFACPKKYLEPYFYINQNYVLPISFQNCLEDINSEKNGSNDSFPWLLVKGDYVAGNKYTEKKDGTENKNGNVNTEKSLSDEQLAHAIEKCQQYFWANSAYAVVFCMIRDDYNKEMTQTSFETMVEMLPYKKDREHTCPSGTIANAFSDNPVFKIHVSKWEAQGASSRILTLLKMLRENLNL